MGVGGWSPDDSPCVFLLLPPVVRKNTTEPGSESWFLVRQLPPVTFGRIVSLFSGSVLRLMRNRKNIRQHSDQSSGSTRE